jgi:IclR family pca regulon transcriptional regulator
MQAAPATDFVASFAKGLKVIRAFDGRTSARLTVSEVARITDLPRAGARRLLLTLKSLGYVGQDGRHFHLTPRVLEFGYGYLAANQWIERSIPWLRQIANRHGETAAITVLQDLEIIYVARITSGETMTFAINLGARLPAFYLSMGRIQLGALPQAEVTARLRRANLKRYTRLTITGYTAMMERIESDWRQGFSISDQQLEYGYRSIAVPLNNGRGETVAALSMASETGRSSLDRLEQEFLPSLREVQERLSALRF